MNRICYKCKKDKSVDEFPVNRREQMGRAYECKSCVKLRVSKYNRSEVGRKKSRVNSIKRKYGISFDEYQTLLSEHDNKCAICGSTVALSIDHCHKSGFVRGILCRLCNAGLGCFGDRQSVLLNAVEYLKNNEREIQRHRENKDTSVKSESSLE